MVMQYGLHTGKGRIAATLSEAVDRHVYSTCAIANGSQGVAHGEVIVVVGVEVKVDVGIAAGDILEECRCLLWGQDAQRVGL